MTANDVKKIKDVVSGLLEPINEKLDNHTEALMSIEATLKGYGDMYEVNKDKNEELDTRVTKIEKHLDLTSQQ